jgi:PhnB protein
MIFMEEVTMTVKPIPDGYHSITPYLTVEGVARLLDFLKQAFDAEQTMQLLRSNGTIWHTEVKIGDSMVMMSEACGEWKPMPSSIHLYVDDSDATYEKAIQAGATSVMEPMDQFYGDRSAGVKDPVGNFWWIATHKEDLLPDEIAKRAEAWEKQHSS